MSKISIFILCLVSAFGVVSCSSNEKGSARPSKNELISHFRKALEKENDDKEDIKLYEEYLKCAFDKSYDKLSTKYLTAVMNADFQNSDLKKVTTKKEDAILESSDKQCVKETGWSK